LWRSIIAAALNIPVESLIVPPVAGGKMRALALASERRTALAPDLPTVGEAGLRGFEVDLWYGLLAPRGTPKAVVDRLNREVNAIVQQADVKERIVGLASVPLATTTDEFGALIARDVDKWTAAIRQSNIVAD
jgi:tripartite-type tricarboxylate transporter receptor subunit TctC